MFFFLLQTMLAGINPLCVATSTAQVTIRVQLMIPHFVKRVPFVVAKVSFFPFHCHGYESLIADRKGRCERVACLEVATFNARNSLLMRRNSSFAKRCFLF